MVSNTSSQKHLKEETILASMALSSSFSLTLTRPPFSSIGFKHNKPTVSRRPKSALFTRAQSAAVTRRSGNYKPCIWDDTFLQSLNNPYTGGMYDAKARKLVGIVKRMLNKADHQHLELIDSLERLGLAYHFEEEINVILQQVYNNMSIDHGDANCTLHTTALKFRLLRHHGYHVSQDVFNNFMDKNGGLKASVCDDVKGMVSLYEASFYGMEGESVMDEAMHTTIKYLKAMIEENLDDDESDVVMQVKHALEVPLRKKMERLEARWCIETRRDIDPILIELAKLDYNRVQALYQDEVKDVSRWWEKSNAKVSLSFVRDRVVSAYLWTTGIASHPNHGNCRRMLGEAILFVCLFDDMYDVYGTLEELELFTEAVERWDVSYAMNRLPNYMKVAFLLIFNWVHQKAYDALTEQGCDVVLNFKNAWLLLLKTYIVEAKWYNAGYAPTLKEYMDNGWISVGPPTLIILSYMLINKPIVMEELHFLETLPAVLNCTSSLIRLEDDLGTSSDELKRGDVLKSIQCYMHETGCSEEDARKHARQLVEEGWKKINKYEFEVTPLPKSSVQFMVDFASMSHFMYRYGDGHGNEDYTKEMASKLLFDPIPLNYKGNIDGAM